MAETPDDGEHPVQSWERKFNIAMARIVALEHLLVCYRTSTRPKESLHRELARTKRNLDEATSG